MAKAFVTGATGFVGSHVAWRLLREGWNVVALRRGSSRHPTLLDDCPGLEWVTADLADAQRLRSAMQGCSAVFHVAADYRLWARDPQEIYRNNVLGTENVLEAACRARVDRVVYTSSVGALGLNPDGSPADEQTPVSLDRMIGNYKRSKFLAERKAEEFAARGLPVVIVNPSTPIGPGDHKPTPTGKIVADYLNRKMLAFVDTGLNLVHVNDVAAGHLLALEKGSPGEKYILGNANITLAGIFKILERLSGIPAPRIRLPQRLVVTIARVCEGISCFTGREPLVPLEGVKMARRYMFFDAAKAVRVLGMPQTPIESALVDAVEWYVSNGYVKKPLPAQTTRKC